MASPKAGRGACETGDIGDGKCLWVKDGVYFKT